MRIAAVWGATALLTLSAVPGTAQSYMGGGGEMSGPYAGGQYGRFGYDAEGSVGGADTTDTIEQGYIGAHAGYLAPVYPFVLGGEVSLDLFHVGDVEYRESIGNRGGDSGEIEVDDWANLMRFKAIGGYDAGRAMPYITAGLSRLTIGDDATGGYFIGIGGAVNVTPQFSLGLEGIYDVFDEPTLCSDDGCLDYGDGASGTTIMLKGSYRF